MHTPLPHLLVPSIPGMAQQQPQQSQQPPIPVVMKVDPTQPGGLPAGVAPGAAVQVVQKLPGGVMGTTAVLQQPQSAQAAVTVTVGLEGQQGGQQEQQLGGQGQGQVSSLPQAFEKKLRRLEKNRESARGQYGCMYVHIVIAGWMDS